MKTGIDLIAEERARQISVEGWTAEHDDEHRHGELVRAAVCYALPQGERDAHFQTTYRLPAQQTFLSWFWPFEWFPSWWKPTPTNRVRELIKAGALIAAEIDRLQRKSP